MHALARSGVAIASSASTATPHALGGQRRDRAPIVADLEAAPDGRWPSRTVRGCRRHELSASSAVADALLDALAPRRRADLRDVRRAATNASASRRNPDFLLHARRTARTHCRRPRQIVAFEDGLVGESADRRRGSGSARCEPARERTRGMRPRVTRCDRCGDSRRCPPPANPLKSTGLSDRLSVRADPEARFRRARTCSAPNRSAPKRGCSTRGRLSGLRFRLRVIPSSYWSMP